MTGQEIAHIMSKMILWKYQKDIFYPHMTGVQCSGGPEHRMSFNDRVRINKKSWVRWYQEELGSLVA